MGVGGGLVGHEYSCPYPLPFVITEQEKSGYPRFSLYPLSFSLSLFRRLKFGVLLVRLSISRVARNGPNTSKGFNSSYSFK